MIRSLKLKIGKECFKLLPKDKYGYTSLNKIAKKYMITELEAGHCLDFYIKSELTK